MHVCNILSDSYSNGGNKDSAVVRALASHQSGPGVDHIGGRRQMWAEFVVGSRPCSERFFSGYSGGCATVNSHLFIYLFIYLCFLFLFYLCLTYGCWENASRVASCELQLRVASCSCES